MKQKTWVTKRRHPRSIEKTSIAQPNMKILINWHRNDPTHVVCVEHMYDDLEAFGVCVKDVEVLVGPQERENDKENVKWVLGLRI